MKRKLVTLSGVDGSGKSTQLDLLASYFKAKGRSYALLWHRPGYSQRLNRLRTLIRRFRPSSLPTADQATARIEILSKHHVQRTWIIMAMLDSFLEYTIKVRWLLLTNQFVVCDRYVIDALLDLKLNFPGIESERSILTRLLRRLAPKPNLALMLMLPFDESSRRLSEKHEPFPDPAGVRRQRFLEYQRISSDADIKVIDAARTPELVHEDILSLLYEWL